MSDIFISYSSADRERAKLLADALTEQGWSVWWDRQIPPGRQFDEVIEEALEAARCVVVLWSQASANSTWVKTEAAEAMQRKALIPTLIEPGVRIPLEFRRLQAADLSKWGGDRSDPQLAQFFASIEAAVGRSGAPRTDAAAARAEPVRAVEQSVRAQAAPSPAPQAAPSARKWSPATIGLIAGAVVVVIAIGAYLQHASTRDRAEQAQDDARRQQERVARDTADKEAQQRKAQEETRTAKPAAAAPAAPAAQAQAQARGAASPPPSGSMNLQWRDHALAFSGTLTWTPASATLRANVSDLHTGAPIGSYNVPAHIMSTAPAEYAVVGEFAVPGDSMTPGPHSHTSRLIVRLDGDGSLRFVQNCPRPNQCY